MIVGHFWIGGSEASDSEKLKRRESHIVGKSFYSIEKWKVQERKGESRQVIDQKQSRCRKRKRHFSYIKSCYNSAQMVSFDRRSYLKIYWYFFSSRKKRLSQNFNGRRLFESRLLITVKHMSKLLSQTMGLIKQVTFHTLRLFQERLMIRIFIFQ